jgi:hypothetical protein
VEPLSQNGVSSANDWTLTGVLTRYRPAQTRGDVRPGGWNDWRSPHVPAAQRGDLNPTPYEESISSFHVRSNAPKKAGSGHKSGHKARTEFPRLVSISLAVTEPEGQPVDEGFAGFATTSCQFCKLVQAASSCYGVVFDFKCQIGYTS